MDIILSLPSFYTEPLDFLRELAPYLSDDDRYKKVEQPGALTRTAFAAHEEQLMLNHKFQVHTEPVRGTVYGFKAAQFFKGNSRPVWDCRIKAAFESELPHYHLQNQHSIAKQLHTIVTNNPHDTVFVQFDFAAFYDQFPLSPQVASYFCFEGRHGETFALTRLPMGFTLACAIAQATTWQLLNFQRRSAVFTCIDNVAFAGPLPDVHHDVCLFMRRCHEASVTLNDHSTPSIVQFLSANTHSQLATIQEWHKDSFVFLGVQYRWSDARKSLATKTIEKLAAARGCLLAIDDAILPRQLAAIMGLLRHANQVLGIPGYERLT